MIILIILKIIAVILLAVLGIILILLLFPVSVKISYIGEKKYYKLKYAFITLISSDKNSGIISRFRNRNKKNSEKSEASEKSIPHTRKTVSEENSEKTDEYTKPPNPEKPQEAVKTEKIKKSEKKNSVQEKSTESRLKKLPEMWDKITQIWEIASSPTKRLCRGFHIGKIFIDFRISDPDAYDCALKYGRICIVLYNTLGILDKMFSVSKKSIDVKCIFNKEKSIYDISFTLRFHPITGIACALSFLWTYYFKIYRKKSGGKKHGKQKANK